MTRTILVLLLGVALASPLAGAADRAAYLRLDLRQVELLGPLPRWVDVDHRRDRQSLYVYVPEERIPELEALGFRIERLPDPGLNPGARMDLAERAPFGIWDSYPTWSGYVAMLQSYATAYPAIARLVDLGPTTNTTRPHRLWAMRISDNPDLQEDEPEVFLTSTLHGDETVGWINTLHLIDELLTHYDPASIDPYTQRLTALVDHAEIWILPLGNPDGTYFGSDASVASAIRYFTNANGTSSSVDPNRDFPDPADGETPPYWLETQTMMAFAGEHPFALSANFHGGAEVVNLPWDCWERLHVDDDWFWGLGMAYATLAQTYGPPGYMTDLFSGSFPGVTNGWAWYEVHGGRQDYTTYFHGGRETTIELSHTKNPPGSELPVFWEANREAMLLYLERARRGVRGLVTDAYGTPLAAEVETIGREADNGRVFTDPDVGDYHRLLLPGTYGMRYRATGYDTLELAGVVVAAGNATRRDVALLHPGESPPLFADTFETGAPCRWSAVTPAGCNP